MLRFVLVLIALSSQTLAQIQYRYAQCGGSDYKGPSQCESGFSCFRQHNWYSQCLQSCPAGWECNKVQEQAQNTIKVGLFGQCGGSGYAGATECDAGLSCQVVNQWYSQCVQGTGATQSPSPTTTSSNLVASTGSLSAGKFPACQFRFGTWFNNQNYDFSSVDYIGIWIGSPSTTHGTNFNPYWHGEMLKTCLRFNKMPQFYAYIIAFMARDQWGLKDCDVGSPNLCERGSDFIRAKRADIIATYKNYASETAKVIGANAQMLWLIEPDFWQYYGDRTQQNGGLSGAFMRQFFDDIATTIKASLPNALISWDISAWIGEAGMRTWWGFFASSPHIDFIHTSGGQGKAGSSEIKPNELRWAFMSTLTGKRIIADTGYGVGGGSDGHNYDWDNLTNLRARLQDGVIAVSQSNARLDWSTTLTSLRANLPKLC